MLFSITLIIIIITAIVSVSAFSNGKVMNDLIFYPPAVTHNRQYYRFITCGFIHADLFHLVFNMYALYLFGSSVEGWFALIFGNQGKFIYILMYVSALAACLSPHLFKTQKRFLVQESGSVGGRFGSNFCKYSC